jgi:hypothetical protein
MTLKMNALKRFGALVTTRPKMYADEVADLFCCVYMNFYHNTPPGTKTATF